MRKKGNPNVHIVHNVHSPVNDSQTLESDYRLIDAQAYHCNGSWCEVSQILRIFYWRVYSVGT